MASDELYEHALRLAREECEHAAEDRGRSTEDQVRARYDAHLAELREAHPYEAIRRFGEHPAESRLLPTKEFEYGLATRLRLLKPHAVIRVANNDSLPPFFR